MRLLGRRANVWVTASYGRRRSGERRSVLDTGSSWVTAFVTAHLPAGSPVPRLTETGVLVVGDLGHDVQMLPGGLVEGDAVGPDGTALPSAALALGGTFTGSGSNDTVYFVGGSSANPFGNVTLNEPAGANGDTLDFASFLGGGVTIDLNMTGKPWVVNAASGLALTLPANGAFTNVIGSPGNDRITKCYCCMLGEA